MIIPVMRLWEWDSQFSSGMCPLSVANDSVNGPKPMHIEEALNKTKRENEGMRFGEGRLVGVWKELWKRTWEI